PKLVPTHPPPPSKPEREYVVRSAPPAAPAPQPVPAAAPAHASAPPPVAAQFAAPVAAQFAAPVAAQFSPQSVQPQVMPFAQQTGVMMLDDAPVRRKRRGRGVVWVLVAIVGLPGVAFASYRTRALQAAARALHQEDRYLGAERAALTRLGALGLPV